MDDKKNQQPEDLTAFFDKALSPLQKDAPDAKPQSAYLGMMGWPYNVPKNNS